MKKKALWIILATGIAVSTALLTAWIIIFTIPRQKKEINGISFISQTLEYDAEPHSLKITGTLPEGVTVMYDNNAKTDVGVYSFTAHFEDLSGKYMVPADMTATLTILPAKLSVSLEDKTVIYDGQEHSLEITGELPEGIFVVYENNRQTEIGSYTVIARFIHENSNYEPLEPLQAVLTVKSKAFDAEEIHFPDAVFVYDGTAKSALISSELPDGVWVEYENNGQIHAGSYEIQAVLRSERDNEILGILYAMLYIEKAKYDMSGVSFKSSEVFYDGATHVLQITGKLPVGVSVRYENNTLQEIGEIRSVVYFSGDASNYMEIPSMTATLTVKKGILHTVSFENKTVSYDGTLKCLEFDGNLPAGVSAVYQNNGQIHAGSYEIGVLFHDATDHYEDLKLTAILTIEQAVYDMSGIQFSDFTAVYDGTPHTLEITGELPEGVRVCYTENSLISAGRLEVIASFIAEDTENYQPIPSMSAFLTVAPAVLEGVSLESMTVPYDGKIHGLVLTGELPAGVTYDFINNYHSEIGEYTVSVHFNISNYEDLTAKLTITKARYSMEHIYFHGQTFTYDRTLHRIEITGTLPQGVSVVYENNTLLNVGEAIAVARFIIEDTDHYEPIADMTAVLRVVESEIEGISFEDATYIYDGTVHSVAVKGELPEGVTVEYQNNFQLHAGSYTVIASFTDSTGNYTVPADMTAVLKIGKADYGKGGILFEDRSFTYDGTVHRLTLYCEDLPEEITVLYENNDKTDAGVYTVKASFEDLYGDYNAVAPVYAILTIERAVCDLSGIVFEDTSYPYDGSEHSLEIIGRLPYGVSVSYSPNTLTGLGRLEVTATFSVDERNYYPIADMTAVLTVTQGTLSGISFNDMTVVYDGNYHDISIEGELPEGVEVRYIYNHQCNAGIYTVYAEFSDSVGYYNGMTATLTILKAVYDMSGIVFEDTDYTYDGTVHTLEIAGKLPEGVSVSYSENELTAAGFLQVTASFIGSGNYEPIADMTAVLTVNKATVQGIVFSDDTVIYDGQPHAIYAFGYPSEIRVIYFNNEGTDAGIYTATATFIGNGNYEPIADMTAVLTVLPKEIDKISLEDETFVLDGKTHSLTLKADLPAGVTAAFENNAQMYEGSYTVKMTLECSSGNYILPDPVYAVLTIISDGTYHSVIFYMDTKEEIRIVKNGEALSDIPLPSERAGYTGSWNYDFTAITAKTECYATYEANLYRISFETGTDETIQDITVVYHEELMLPTPERAGYVFQKWIDGEGKEVGSGVYTVPSDLILYAVWQCKVIYQSVTGYVYEEDMVSSQELTAPKGNYSRYLTGWYLDFEYENPFDFDTPVEENTVLYARYEYDYLFEISENDTAVITEVIRKDKTIYAIDLIYDIYPVSEIVAGAFNGCSDMQFLSVSTGGMDSLGRLFGTQPYDGAIPVAQSDDVYYVPSSLSSVSVLGQSVSYGAFYGCTMLKECVLENVGSVGGYAFSGCIGLESLTLSGDISLIEENAFSGCSALHTVYASSLTQWCKIRFEAETANPMLYADTLYVSEDTGYVEVSELDLTSIREIGPYQFAGFAGITKILMPDTVSVGVEAFKGLSRLFSVEFGESMRELGSNAFSGCTSLNAVYYTGTVNQWCEILIQNAYATPMAYADGFYLKAEDIWTPVTEIALSGVSTLGDYQFYGFSEIKQLSLSEELCEIGSYAVADCGALELLSFTFAVKDIARYAFYNLFNLQTVRYDGTINDWAEIVFANQYATPMRYAKEIEFIRDTDSQNAVLSEEITSIGNYQFYGLTGLITVRLSDSLSGIGNSAFSGCILLEEITFGTVGTVKFLSNAFYGCTALKNIFYTKEITGWQEIRFTDLGATPLNTGASVYICGNPVESVEILSNLGAYQFYGFKDMSTAVIGAEVTELGKYALARCTALTEVVLPSAVTALGSNCFEGNQALANVVLGEGIVSVSEACFKGCEALKAVVMPSVVSVGSYAFSGCLALNNINTANITQIGESSFYGCLQLGSVDLSGVGTIPANAFMNCSGLTDVILSDSLQTVKSSAFNGCTALERIVLPSSVQTIAAYAFMGCSRLNIFVQAEEKPAAWDANWAVGALNVYWFRESEPEASGLYWHYEEEEIVLWNAKE